MTGAAPPRLLLAPARLRLLEIAPAHSGPAADAREDPPAGPRWQSNRYRLKRLNIKQKTDDKATLLPEPGAPGGSRTPAPDTTPAAAGVADRNSRPQAGKYVRAAAIKGAGNVSAA
jgi:hypothetical protein